MNFEAGQVVSFRLPNRLISGIIRLDARGDLVLGNHKVENLLSKAVEISVTKTNDRWA